MWKSAAHLSTGRNVFVVTVPRRLRWDLSGVSFICVYFETRPNRDIMEE
jgi:hypothetical protein